MPEITDLNGRDLVEHVIFYGMNRDEFESLSLDQLRTLEAAGIVDIE